MAATFIFRPVVTLTAAISAPIHPTILPVPLMQVLHATRISLAFRGQRKRLKSQMSWGADMAGFLLMVWGGGILVNTLLALPIPQILSSTPWLTYGLTHIILTNLLDTSFLPNPSPKTLDTALPLIDAILRSAPIVGAVESCRRHPNISIKESMFAQLFLGALAASGGGLMGSTLGVWEHDWRFRRPPFLDGGIINTLDLWSGSLAAFVYGFLQLSHPWYGAVYEAWGFEPVARFTPLAARSMAVLSLTVCYAVRVYATHYKAPSSVKENPVAVETKKTQ